jgi:hypothetical protein
VAEGKADKEPALVDRWLREQQEWQRTILSYLDSMIKNDDFLVHLGNAMRGSLLAGKPYPAAAVPGAPAAPETLADDRLDKVLFGINQLQGQLQDVLMTLDEIRSGRNGQSPTPPHVATPHVATPAKPLRAKRRPATVPPSRARERRVRE